MTTEALESQRVVGTHTGEPLASGVRFRIFLYLGLLTILLGFGSPYGGLIDVPISFFLKNKFHLSASEVANFRIAAGLPLYFSFAFGFARDSWSPFGIKDRGFMILFGAFCAAFYLVFAFMPVSYLTLLIAVVLLTASFLFVSSALNGLMSVIGQQHVMSGQISAVSNIFGMVPVLAAFLIGGVLSDALESSSADEAARILFLIGAVIMMTVAVYGFWKPRTVFGNVTGEGAEKLPSRDNLIRLARHWPIYPALAIWMLWNFAPGSQTPLQFYLQNTLHASDAQWGQWNAIFAGSFIPTFVLYGYLCRKVPLKTLLWWGTVVAVPQMIPLLLINSIPGALIAAGIIGLLGGVSSAAYIDLLIRSCPRGLQGTVMMMSGSLYYIASRFGDALGTNLYDRYHGFTVCVIAITVVYALILPVLLLVPKRLIATADGEEPEGGFAAD
jgi:predicted MFS family arabinose efflux permease